MKKVCWAIFMLVLAGTNAFAQDENKLGFKAGVNFSSLGGDDKIAFEKFIELGQFETRVGYHVGIMGSLILAEGVALQPEILYSRQGAGFVKTDKVKWNVSYIHIPLMLKAYVTEGLNFQVGPQLGVLLENKLTEGDEELDWREEGVDTSDMEIAGGLGLNYEMKMGLNVGLRYTHGFSNLFDKVGETPLKLSSRAFQLSIGYFFSK